MHKFVLTEQDLQKLKEKDHRISGWRLWDETLLVVQVKSEGRKVLERLVHDPVLEGVKMVAIVSEDVDLEDRTSTLWGIFTRFDCGDFDCVVFSGTHLVGSVWPAITGCLGIDASMETGLSRLPGDT